jgi:hypothetical protein
MRVWMLAVLSLLGCTSGPAPGEAEAVAARFAEAVRQHDGAAACALLSERTRDDLGDSCATALPRLGLRPGTPRTAEVWGDSAQVRTTSDTVFLGSYAAGWRITGAGCAPRGADLPYDCALGGS